MVEQKVQRVESVLKQIRELKEDDEKAAKATGKILTYFPYPASDTMNWTIRHSSLIC